MVIVQEYYDFLQSNMKLELSTIRGKLTKVIVENDEMPRAKAFKIVTDSEYILSSGVFPDTPQKLFELVKETKSIKDFNSWVNKLVKTAKTREFTEKSKDFNMDHVTPLVDLETGDMFLWDGENDKLSDVAYKAYIAILGQGHVNALRDAGMIKWAKFEYNPYNLLSKTTGDIDGREVTTLNRYNPPPWRFNKQEGRLRSEIKAFFKHLFPDVKDRSIVFSFLKQSILDRCSHIMVLEGKRAVGKNIFVENIVAPLVGMEYFAKAPKGFFESRFQDILINNRLIFFDEMEAKDDNAMNDIKRLANHTQGVEKKGQDLAQYNAYYSCIANTNDPQSFPVQFDERRIFFPEITPDRLEAVWGKQRIKDFLTLLKDDDAISELGHFIIERAYDKDFDPENAYINDKFKDMVTINLTPARAFIVDYLINCPADHVNIYTLKADYDLDGPGGRFLSETKIKIFIENYLHDGKKLGDYVKIKGKGKININPEIQFNVIEEEKELFDE